MHAYDPACYCADCCSHEQRVESRIEAEERKLRERRKLAAAYAVGPALALQVVSAPHRGRR